MNKAGLLGLVRQARASQHITTHGTTLTVQRKASGAGAQPTTQTLTCIPMTDAKAIETLMAEGDINAANDQPMQIIFKATDSVKEDVDRVIYHNYYYKLTSVYPSAEQNGVVISWIANAIRDGKAA